MVQLTRGWFDASPAISCSGRIPVTSLLAGKAKLWLPRAVSLDNVPVALSNTPRVKGSTGDDLPGDRERRHPYAVRLQVGPEHRRGRPESGFAERDRREGRDRMVCECPR
jgi:hypothetical protein